MLQIDPGTHELTESEMVIRELYEITSRYEAGFNEQVRDLLRLGCARFDLDIGIVSRIEDDTYEVVEVVSPSDIELSVGDRFELGNTYCSTTLNADGPVGFEHAGQSDMATHPAYSAFGLESYIGIPIRVGNEVFGTLNFSSPSVRTRQFQGVDVDCLKLMERWLAAEIHRGETERELAAAKSHLEHLVRTDPLTELLNRRGVVEMLTRIARRDSRDGVALSCVLLDIDDFKRINDGYGHSTGDHVIRAVGQAVRAALRPGDLAGRIGGGDEFIAILPDTTVNEARSVGCRMREAVRFLDIKGRFVNVQVTASIGLAQMPPKITDVTELLGQLETHLQASKSSGKDTVSG